MQLKICAREKYEKDDYMKTGKVSDTILSRSVLKPVNTVRGKYVKRLDIGQDAG